MLTRLVLSVISLSVAFSIVGIFCQCSAEERAKYSCNSFCNDGRHLILLTDGDGQGQKASIAVFDVLRPDYRLRKLVEMDLFNDCSPSLWWLCGTGRFFVTFGEGYVHEDQRKLKNLLCVYDLVRKEATRYQLTDLFTDDQIQLLLDEDGSVQDYCLFNPLFPPNLQRASEDMQLTIFVASQNFEIVVDLQSRSSKVKINASRPTSEELDTDFSKTELLFSASKEPQSGQNALIPKSADVRPKMLRLALGDKTLYYELQPLSGEYEFASSENWVEKNQSLARPICVTPTIP
jgi:hypothetical protein